MLYMKQVSSTKPELKPRTIMVRARSASSNDLSLGFHWVCVSHFWAATRWSTHVREPAVSHKLGYVQGISTSNWNLEVCM